MLTTERSLEQKSIHELIPERVEKGKGNIF